MGLRQARLKLRRQCADLCGGPRDMTQRLTELCEQYDALFEYRYFVNGQWWVGRDMGADKCCEVRRSSHAALGGAPADSSPVSGSQPYRDPIGCGLARRFGCRRAGQGPTRFQQSADGNQR
jgi:hypothetical protein